MSRQTGILLQVAIWLVLYLSPLSFMNHGNGVDFMQFLMMSVSPLLLMVVFYANYLWLTPRLLVRGEKRYYWLVNIVLCVGMGIILHFWMSFVHGLFSQGESRLTLSVWQVLLFILRDIFNLSIAAAIATTIQLSMRWNQSEKARREAEVARADAELSNLRNQINPHFLLNTLNNIYALTAIDRERAQKAIQQLSCLLRHMLYENQQQEVSFNDEVQFLENYVSLMKIRLSQSVDVSFYSESKVRDSKIAPLLFISLVENAFKHGISPTEQCFVYISVVSDGQQVVCDIENSNHPKNSQDRSGHGIGLQQVQRRLDLIYPDRYRWEKGISEDGRTYRSRLTIFNS